MNKIPELLAPSGSMDSLYAAIKGGADAVYFGGKTANARNAAKNFSDEEISRAVNLLHGNGKFAYITLNTLHTDREMANNKNISELLKFAEHCYISGADAFIVQDIGLSQIIRKYFPDIKIHASTQTAGHNLYSAQKFYELGFSRMVIARELDRENLKYLIDNSPLEIEMFVHGALCSSHSGRCFMSFALGNTRSANMGMCAQPCRLKYSGEYYNNGYALSLKDQCLAGHIKEIIGLSPASLKIEGRMKPPEYVYNVCKIYRACLDENRDATEHEINFLAKIFSRQGFTDGYFTRKPGTKNERSSFMYGVRTEENKTESKKHSLDFKFYAENQMREISGSAKRSVKSMQIPPISNVENIKINPKLCLIFNSFSQFSQVSEFIETEDIFKRIYKIFMPLENFANHEIPAEFNKITGVKLPYVIFDGERERIAQTIKNIGANHVLTDNIGHIDIVKESGASLELSGNFGLNVTNSYTLDEYRKLGFKDIILSPELNFAQIRDINKTVNCGITAYGRTHVMISENCIIKNAGKCDKSKCKCDGNFYLTDKTGAKFLVCGDQPEILDFGYKHRNIIYNSVPVYLADKKNLYKNIGLFFITLNFTDETPGQIKKIISDYALNKDNIHPPAKFTRGYK